jgi:tRNA G10  N-methylase Trm11
MSTLKQNVYSFVSGKNWKLSLAEITAFLDARGCRFEVSEFSRSFFTIKTPVPLEASVIDELGGTLKIAQAVAFVPTERITDAFIKENKQVKKQLKFDFPLDDIADLMPRAASGKSVFGVSVYWADPTFRPAAKAAQRFLGSALKDELKEQDKKTRFMGFPRDRENPQLTPVEVLKQGLVENHAEVLLCIGLKETSIGTTLAAHNPFEFQKRDVEKPMQRKMFAIPPRLAKIMINLTQCTPGKTFLDPFCGVGTILQEALLAEAKVVGLDINRWCVEAAKQNLDWIVDEYDLRDANYSVVQGDVRDMTRKIGGEIDCIATEPDLGPALRELPTVEYAQEIVNDLTPLFESFLSESHQVFRDGGRLAVVTPYIRVRLGKPARMDIRRMAESVGFTTVKPFSETAFVESAADFPLREMTSFIEVDERHMVGREITVFQKAE